ncbi:MAG: hypothetical protein JXA90_09735, partial [Planctomycetes bacterium]|nr:hypothetical protein [Planctomycetota bacterium]
LEESIRGRFPWVADALEWPDGKPFWSGRRLFPCLGAQAHSLDGRFRDSLLAIQVGRFFEFYGPRAEDVARLAKLKLIRGRRAGYRGWARIPVARFSYLLDAARRARVGRIVVASEAADGGAIGVCARVIPRVATALGRRCGGCVPTEDGLLPRRNPP